MSPRLRHYRAPTKPLATAWARHLDAVMRERDLSQTNVFDEIREEMGYAPTSRSALLRVFSDKDPDPRLAEVLTAHYGAPPPEAQAPAVDLSLLERQVLAMERQAAAAERQADTLALLVDMLSGRTPLDQAAVAASLVEAVRVGAQSQSPLAAPQPDRESA